MLSHIGTISERDRQTDGQTDRIARSISFVIIAVLKSPRIIVRQHALKICRVFQHCRRILTSSSAIAEKPCDASCLSVVSFNSTKRRVEWSLLLLLT